MKHCISIPPGSSYTRIIELVLEDDETVTVESLTTERDGNGESFQLLTLTTYFLLAKETEREVDDLPEVIVSTFNINDVD